MSWGQDDAQQQAILKTDARTRRVSSGQLTPEEGLSREEIFRRLRALGQPVTLFGEVGAYLVIEGPTAPYTLFPVRWSLVTNVKPLLWYVHWEAAIAKIKVGRPCSIVCDVNVNQPSEHQYLQMVVPSVCLRHVTGDATAISLSKATIPPCPGSDFSQIALYPTSP